MPIVYPYTQYSGIWNISSQANAKGAGTWPALTTKLYVWGLNSTGQLGLNNTISYSSPKQLASTVAWSATASAKSHSISTKANGTLWSWGDNTYGQLGLGNTTLYSSPMQVGALTTWTVLSTNSGTGNVPFSMALKSDGTLWGAGRNAYGTLGNSNTTNVSSFTQVGALTTWSKISVGFGSAIAIKTNGTLWAWGYNGLGQLGLNNISNYSSPVQVGSLTTWAKVTSNYYSTAAIKTDGTLWTWGYNSAGQLGLGNLTYAWSSPQQVGSLTNWLSVSGVGASSFAAIKTDGTLWTWGTNGQGMLGIGNQNDQSSPVQVGALTTWLSVAGGIYHMIAIKTDGTLWTWGKSSNGQLGLGNTTSYSSPKQVGALTGWLTATAGGYGSSARLNSF